MTEYSLNIEPSYILMYGYMAFVLLSQKIQKKSGMSFQKGFKTVSIYIDWRGDTCMALALVTMCCTRESMYTLADPKANFGRVFAGWIGGGAGNINVQGNLRTFWYPGNFSSYHKPEMHSRLNYLFAQIFCGTCEECPPSVRLIVCLMLSSNMPLVIMVQKESTGYISLHIFAFWIDIW